MEQIFMLEIFVTKIILKKEVPKKTPSEILLQEEAEKRAEQAAALAAALAAVKGKKGKKAKPPKKAKKGKKGKKGKEPLPPSEEEIKLLQTCAMQMHCLPVFNLNITHDNFVEPPPPPPPPKAKKKGKKGKPKKPKKKKKGKKKGKPKGPLPRIINLPSEPLPQPPFFGVGETVTFISRPSTVKTIMLNSPISIRVWNRNVEFDCIGVAKLNWHHSFITTLDQANELNPVLMDTAEYRNTTGTEIVTNTVQFLKPLHCEEDLKPSGEIEFFIKLSCLGNKLQSFFVSIPEFLRLPGRLYLSDETKLRDLEVVRHWDRSNIEEIPPVAHLFTGPDITREPSVKVTTEPQPPFEDFVAPFTSDELVILSMGFPKGPCGGTNCPRRMEYRGSQHQFIPGQYVKGKYQHGMFVNKRDVHGPCGRLDCPLAKSVRSYLCDEGMYKPCKKPCSKDYY